MVRAADKRVRAETAEAPAAEAAVPAQPAEAAAPGRIRVKLALRKLDTGKPEEYDSWRYALRAGVVRAGPPTAKMIQFLDAVDNPTGYPAGALQAAIAIDEEISAVDAMLFSLILDSLDGSRRVMTEERIRGQVPFAAGALALRCLDVIFQKNSGQRRFVATQELMDLQPAGRAADAYGRFFTRFRLLLQQAGPSHVGSYAQINILRRAAEGCPRLNVVWAAWREAGGEDPEALLGRLEEAVYEGIHGKGNSGGRQGDAAWAVLTQDDGWGSRDGPQLASGAANGWSLRDNAAAAAAAAQYPRKGGKATGKGSGAECWKCGKTGHVKAECPSRTPSGPPRQDEVMQKLDELISLLKDSGIAKKC